MRLLSPAHGTVTSPAETQNGRSRLRRRCRPREILHAVENLESERRGNWRDDPTGMIHYELVLVAPVPFEEAVTRAQEEAPKRSVERIHVKHARSSNKLKRTAKTKRAAKISVAQSKRRAPVKRKTAKLGTGRRKQPT